MDDKDKVILNLLSIIIDSGIEVFSDVDNDGNPYCGVLTKGEEYDFEITEEMSDSIDMLLEEDGE